MTEPGVIRQDGKGAARSIGEPDSPRSDRVVALAQAMTEADVRAPVRGNIRGEIWTKMANSLGWNPVAVPTGATLGVIADRPEIVAIVRRMMTETEAVANALGVVLPQPMEKRFAITLAAREHRMSMLQDLTRGRPLEIDVLACSVAEMRSLVGLTTPTIDKVLDLARLRGIGEV